MYPICPPPTPMFRTSDASDAPFNLLWWRGRSNLTNQSIYLLHSDDALPAATLGAMFRTSTVLHVKHWPHAFPIQRPAPTPADLPPLVLGNGALYLNAIETVASSMETTAIGARNAARLLMKPG